MWNEREWRINRKIVNKWRINRKIVNKWRIKSRLILITSGNVLIEYGMSGTNGENGDLIVQWL